VRVGATLANRLAAGGSAGIKTALGVTHLGLNQESFDDLRVQVTWRNPFRDESAADKLISHSAGAAILSDSWSSAAEDDFRVRVDALTVDELVESLEIPGRIIATQAQGKGKALYGEGQFARDVDLRPRSDVLPARYVERK
jgi:hypothetical protein